MLNAELFKYFTTINNQQQQGQQKDTQDAAWGSTSRKNTTKLM